MLTQARFTHDRVSFNDAENGHLIVSLTGEDAGRERERPLIGLIPIVDRTGSMASDNKLSVAKAALNHLVRYLREDDLLGLVAFDDYVEELVFPAAGSRDAYQSALGSLSPQGMTNLAAGLTHGVAVARAVAEQLRESTPWFELRIILISDGLANVGITDPEIIAAITRDLPDGVRVTTIGVGRDCDHDLLGQIAAAGGGSYGFAENAEAIAGLIGGELGGLVSIDATSIDVRVTPRETVRLEAPLGVTSKANGGGFAVSVPTLLAGETRHLVFPITTVPPGRRHARRVTACDVEINGVTREGPFNAKMLPKLFFDGGTSTVAPTLRAIVDKAVAGEALREAEKLSRAQSWKRAARVLRNASETVTTPGVGELLDGLTHAYASSAAHAAQAVERVSARAAMDVETRLLGSSEAFDANWSRAMQASYSTPTMASHASDTRRAATGSGRYGTQTTGSGTQDVTTGGTVAAAGTTHTVSGDPVHTSSVSLNNSSYPGVGSADVVYGTGGAAHDADRYDNAATKRDDTDGAEGGAHV